MDHNWLRFSVVADPVGRSTATFEFGAKIKPWGYALWPVLRKGMTGAWNQMCEEFKHYVETGTPHPRKVAAIESVSAAVHA